MKVKIKDKIYDSNEEPIMIILSEDDKNNINNMTYEANKYLSYPENMTEEEAINFMKTEDI
jgi:hypothetical protein